MRLVLFIQIGASFFAYPPLEGSLFFTFNPLLNCKPVDLLPGNRRLIYHSPHGDGGVAALAAREKSLTTASNIYQSIITTMLGNLDKADRD